jgi:hypothetical protein
MLSCTVLFYFLVIVRLYKNELLGYLLDFPLLVPTKKPARREDATKSHLTGKKRALPIRQYLKNRVF